MKSHIQLLPITGVFAENKDVARDIRLKHILPLLQKNKEVILDFEGIEAATQSFIHALISDAIRQHGPSVLDKISFKSCTPTVKNIILIVTEYMQI
jgi:hypothetical protein